MRELFKKGLIGIALAGEPDALAVDPVPIHAVPVTREEVQRIEAQRQEVINHYLEQIFDKEDSERLQKVFMKDGQGDLLYYSAVAFNNEDKYKEFSLWLKIIQILDVQKTKEWPREKAERYITHLIGTFDGGVNFIEQDFDALCKDIVDKSWLTSMTGDSDMMVALNDFLHKQRFAEKTPEQILDYIYSGRPKSVHGDDLSQSRLLTIINLYHLSGWMYEVVSDNKERVFFSKQTEVLGVALGKYYKGEASIGDSFETSFGTVHTEDNGSIAVKYFEETGRLDLANEQKNSNVRYLSAKIMTDMMNISDKINEFNPLEPSLEKHLTALEVAVDSINPPLSPEILDASLNIVMVRYEQYPFIKQRIDKIRQSNTERFQGKK
ncbi:MAG: hypothetical protein WCV88_01505 [Patescibacteria group bacterium]|jgi:hypothetical protein